MSAKIPKASQFYETGNQQYQSGNLPEAENAYRKAIKLNKGFAEAYTNLGNVLKDMGRFQEAAGAYRKAATIYPDHPLILNNLGAVYRLLGASKEAMACFRKSIERHAANPDAYNNLGCLFRECGRVADAIECFRKALATTPDLAAAHNNLGTALTEEGRYREALESLRRAVTIDPAYLDAYCNLGVVLQAIDRPEEAAKVYRHVLQYDPRNTGVLNNLGIALREQGDAEGAVHAVRQVLDIDPNHKEALINLALLLRAEGNVEEALVSIHRALEIGPGCGEAHKVLSFMRRYTDEGDGQVRDMRALFEQRDVPRLDRMNVGFALAKAYEDLDQYERAFECLREANRLKRETVKYSTEETKKYFQGVKETFTPEFFAAHKNSGVLDDTPIFVLGMPRSGTSLVEQILASHSQVYGAGELRALSQLANKMKTVGGSGFPAAVREATQDDLAALGAKYVGELKKHAEHSPFVTDKMPHNFLYVGLIKVALPNAKIIHCVRDPTDNCLSIFKNLFSVAHQYAYDLTELGEYYALYADLMAHMREVLPGCVHELRYEDLVSQQEEETRRLLGRCGLSWEESCLAFEKTKRTVATLSAMQVRQPIHNKSVGLSRHYEKELVPLRTALSAAGSARGG